MIWKFPICVALISLLTLSAARAAGIARCDHPFAYQSAVNVYVLEDFERDAAPDLQNVRRRLAWLATLDALFRDSYGSLGVHFLAQPGDDGRPCTTDSVVDTAGMAGPANGAASFIDQRVYKESEQIFVETYLRFTRFDADRRRTEETVNVVLRDLPGFSEVLPEQSLAFPPRQLTQGDLQVIEEGFKKASRIYPAPVLKQRGKEMALSPDYPLPFLVTEARPDGWMHVDGTAFGSDLVGWLHADGELSEKLRGLLPELDFLEGAVGFLSYLQAMDDRFLQSNSVVGISRRTDGLLAKYGQNAVKDFDASTTEADLLRTVMVFDDPRRAAEMLPVLFDTVQSSPPDSRLRDLLGMTRLAACCRVLPKEIDSNRSAARLVSLTGALTDFLAQ